ncbi:hypothetical protein HCA69_02440 [Listeria grandensis]|uniref:Uncharacterized protein n=1 Tax=Listeria grandensis TaxID=1494963 RepID=A0A7X0Y2G6_9LIST|nr:hypothetical protein [Listeria grandensis]MBC1935207.1 hypothetical protein [Listeria grandensis]
MTSPMPITINRMRRYELYEAIADAEKRGYRVVSDIRHNYAEGKTYHKEGAFFRQDSVSDTNKYTVRMIKPMKKEEREAEIQSFMDSLIHCEKVTEEEMETWSDKRIEVAYDQLRSELDS